MYLLITEELDGSCEIIYSAWNDKVNAQGELDALARRFIEGLGVDAPSPDEIMTMENSGDLIDEPDCFYYVDTLRITIENLAVLDAP
jgi:hypothetical protein